MKYNLELSMKVRRLSLGDIGLAVLLALPTATLANPSAAIWQSRPTAAVAHVQLAAADRSSASSRLGLLG